MYMLYDIVGVCLYVEHLFSIVCLFDVMYVVSFNAVDFLLSRKCSIVIYLNIPNENVCISFSSMNCIFSNRLALLVWIYVCVSCLNTGTRF